MLPAGSRLIALILLAALCSCPLAAEPDYHTYSNYEEVRVKHIDLDLDVSFASKRLTGTATLVLDWLHRTSELVLDTRDLKIIDAGGLAFQLGPADPILGAPLRIQLPAGVDRVRIAYSTGEKSTALRWAGSFFNTQSWSIHARSWVPLQDTPQVKFTYSARIRAPKGMLALMSAENSPDAPRNGEFHFRMPQAIPPHDLALAVGDLVFRPLGPRTGIYAERRRIGHAAKEFARAEDMLRTAESLYGPYRWDRFDILMLPPGARYGGMENPRVTFLADKAKAATAIHELAHSWAGNLVTNATWSDIWISEGLTTYLAMRIEEDAFHADPAALERNLRRELARVMAKTEDALELLHPDSQGRHPDKLLTLVPYNKGALLLLEIARAAGRDRLDGFLRTYFDRFAFRSISTREFTEYLERSLPAAARVPISDWMNKPGLPMLQSNPQ